MQESSSYQAVSEPTLTRRSVRVVKWALPSTILALMPKCPVCFAGYVALFTGLGISLPTATFIRTGLIVLCMVSLGYLVVSRVFQFVARRRIKSNEVFQINHPTNNTENQI